MSSLGCSVACLLALGLLGCTSNRSSGDDETTRDRIHHLERENAELRESLATLQRRLDFLTRGLYVSVDPAFPPIDARVLEVRRELHLVVLDKGEQHGVKVGYEFTVYRDAQYKGLVRIQDAQEKTSTALILSEKKPIESGDAASTQL